MLLDGKEDKLQYTQIINLNYHFYNKNIKMNKLPLEIISKIQLYSHPILNKNLQKQIHNYIFLKKVII
jgi:hypothetical protein